VSERWLPISALSPEGRPWDVIRLEGLRADCIVGVYPGERLRPQPLELELALSLDTRRAALEGRIRQTVDYGRIAGEIRFILTSCRFSMLETAAETLCRYLLAPPVEDQGRVQIEAVGLRIAKPKALAETCLPSLEVYRAKDEYVYAQEQKGFGHVDILCEAQGFGLYRLRIRPKGQIPTHFHKTMEEHELLLGSGLWVQGRAVPAGTAFSWPKNLPHRYDNPLDVEQSVLCVDLPAFVPSDEVEVEIPLEGLVPIEGVAFYPSGERR
jgi:dihydroneopterin aldolase